MNKLDPGGNDVVLAQVGTVEEFAILLNYTPSGAGLMPHGGASAKLQSFRETAGLFGWYLPTDNYPSKAEARYIYTEQTGWMDMSHFLFYAGRALSNREDGMSEQDAFADAAKDGMTQEQYDSVFARHSAFSYEDLPSDYHGAKFGAMVFNEDSSQTMADQIATYLRGLGATDPGSPPNYDKLPPNAEVAKKEFWNSNVIPFRQNFFFEPVYTRKFP